MFKGLFGSRTIQAAVITVIGAVVVALIGLLVTSPLLQQTVTETNSRNVTVTSRGAGDVTINTGDIQFNVDPNGKLAEELGVTKSALRNFFRSFGEGEIPADELDHKLREFVDRFKHLETELRTYQSDDPEVRNLVGKASGAIREGDLDRAEMLLKEASELDKTAIEKIQSANMERHLSAAHTEAILGNLKMVQFSYLDAANHFLKAIELSPANSPVVRAKYLDDLANAYLEAHHLTDAESAAVKSLKIVEDVLGKEDQVVANPLMTLGHIKSAQNQYHETLPLHLRSLHILEKALGKDNIRVAMALNNLGAVQRQMHQFKDALLSDKRALEIKTKQLGADNISVAYTLSNLGAVYIDMKKYPEAKAALIEALRIKEKVLGASNPALVSTLVNLAALYTELMQCDQAELHINRAISFIKIKKGKDSNLVKPLTDQLIACKTAKVVNR